MNANKKRKEIHLPDDVFIRASIQAARAKKTLKPHLEDLIRTQTLIKEPLCTQEGIISILRNVRALFYKETHNRANWTLVQDILLAHTSNSGKGSSQQFCEELGIDPDGYNF